MLMVIVNEKGIPLNVEVESAATYEGHVAEKTVEGIEVRKHIDRRNKAKQLVPKRVISDKGYDDDKLRAKMRAKGIDFIVPYRKKRVNKPFEDKRKLRRYKKRYRVERTNSWLKNFRRVAIRWDRSLAAYKGFVRIACICITLMKF